MLTIPSAVEEALKNGAQKNFRVHFPNGERADITNDNIVSESVSFTESICSQSELKFGLAEASVLEFETVGVENIRGAEIEASIEVTFPSSENLVVQPFIFGTSYSDDGVYFLANDDNSIYIGRNASATKWTATCSVKLLNLDSSCRYMLSGCPDNANIRLIGTCDGERFVDSGSGVIISNKSSVNITIEVDRFFAYHESATVRPTLINLDEEETYSIPYGKFVVDECPRQTNLEHRKVTAYSYISTVQSWSEFELARRMKPLAEKIPYTYNPFFLALMNSNIRGKIEGATYTPAGVSEYTYTFSIPEYDGISISMRCRMISASTNYITFAQADTDELISEMRTALSSSLTDAQLTWVSEQIKQFANSIVTNAIGLDNPVYVNSPYFYSLPDDYVEPYVALRYSVDNSEGEAIYSKTFRDVSDISNESVSFPYSFPTISLPRTKKSAGQYVCSVVEEYTPNDLLVNCLEILGGFAKNDRNGEMVVDFINDNFEDACYEMQKTEYSSFWYEENATAPYGKVIANYTDTSDEEAYAEVVMTNAYPSLTYDLSNNVVVKNAKMTSAQINTLLSTFASNVSNIRYIASDISSIGLPFLEAGDVIDVVAADDNLVRTFVEKRTISGIQALFDDISSEDTRNTYISGGSSSGGSSSGGGGSPSPVIVNDSTITITQGNFSDSFTLNQSSNKTIELPEPTIPTVNDGTLTIKQDGTTVGTFSANQSGDTTVNITGGGGGGLDLLWTNSSPGNSFTAKTLSLAVSTYAFLLIEIRFTTTTDNYATVIVRTNGHSFIEAFLASANRYRRSITASGSSVTFGSGEKASPSATTYSTDNTCYIPVAIYGMK